MRRREASIDDIAIADAIVGSIGRSASAPLTTRACRTTRNPTVLDRLTASIRQKRSARVKKPVIERVGWAPGFEPGNGGIKIRCLTTWLRPKMPGPRPERAKPHNSAM